jgi:hypothetical protein
MKLKVKGGILLTIGYILSPLSWWNDFVINIPLAYILAFPFGLISRKVFFPVMIFAYWLTNIIGFLLMHRGIRDIFSAEKGKMTRNELAKDIIISLVYSSVVIALIKMRVLKFPVEYFE